MAVAEVGKAAEQGSSSAPVVVDLGAKGRKQIKRLREGRGKLLDEVNTVVSELRSAGTITASAQPVVVVVRARRRPRSLLWPLA